MGHLGINVYLWAERDRDLFIVDCLGPVARVLLQEGAADWFWFDRFDTRGPHVFALFGIRSDRIVEHLRNTLIGYLAARPSTSQLEPEDLARRHEGCRGIALCAADRLPGMAENNTFEIFDHNATAYPFFLGSCRTEVEELWRILNDSAFWVIDQLAAYPDAAVRTAVAWIASIDHQLRLAGADAEDYWHYHLITLVHSFKSRLNASDALVVSGVEKAIGERNRRLFSAAWGKVEEIGPCWKTLPRLVEIALAGRDADPRGPWMLQREIDHFTLKQLGLSHQLHIPLILFAWHRSLSLQS